MTHKSQPCVRTSDEPLHGSLAAAASFIENQESGYFGHFFSSHLDWPNQNPGHDLFGPVGSQQSKSGAHQHTIPRSPWRCMYGYHTLNYLVYSTSSSSLQEILCILWNHHAFGVSSASTHYLPAKATLHFQTTCKDWHMQWPVPGTTHAVDMFPFVCVYFSFSAFAIPAGTQKSRKHEALRFLFHSGVMETWFSTFISGAQSGRALTCVES